ncbi:MAG: gamma-glutamyltransferase [Candidatus Hermodarchaeota archaeon]
MFWRRWTGRSDVIAKEGMVASSQPLATQTGIKILREGGNAIDAAVATAAVLDVVEPFSTGCGGDVFALIHLPNAKQPIGINGSGGAGSLATLENLLEKGWTKIPMRGGAPVTVPGAMHAWAYIVEKFGQLEFKEVLAPAVKYAYEGFPISPVIAEVWKVLVPDVLINEDALRIFSVQGRAPKRGEIVKNPELAQVFTTVGEEGVDAFYNGKIARAIIETIQEHGGFLTLEDLAKHETKETKPIGVNYRGMDVYEHPPNGQGMAALEMLNIMEEFDWSKYSSLDAFRYHIMIEAKKLAYADLHQFNADPEFFNVPLETLLGKKYANQRAKLIDLSKAMALPNPGLKLGEDTIYLAAADSEGRAISFINSLYMGFGSGLVAKGTGIKLQNRGALFSLDPKHPNKYEPEKKPFHTIIPGALYKEKTFYGVFGIMGGSHQSQAHAQFVSNIVDHQMSPQEALEHPRFHHEQTPNTLALENGIPPHIQGTLRKLGHDIVHETMANFGGGQAIFALKSAWIAGSDPRKDGQAAGF